MFNLGKELELRGLNKAQLSRMTGISQSTLKQIEIGGTKAPHPTTIRIIQEALKAYDSEKGLISVSLVNERLKNCLEEIADAWAKADSADKAIFSSILAKFAPNCSKFILEYLEQRKIKKSSTGGVRVKKSA